MKGQVLAIKVIFSTDFLNNSQETFFNAIKCFS